MIYHRESELHFVRENEGRGKKVIQSEKYGPGTQSVYRIKYPINVEADMNYVSR